MPPSLPLPRALFTTAVPARVPSPARPPLLFLHGLLGSSSTYSSLLARADCAPSSPKLSFDLPGHGRSAHPSTRAGYALPALAAAVASAAPAQTDLAGHSLGGKVAMALALRNPAAVRRLVVVDVAPVEYKIGAGAMDVPRAAVEAMRRLEAGGGLGGGSLPLRKDVDAALEREGVHDAGVRAFVCTNLVVGARRGAWRWRCDVGGLCGAMDVLTGFDVGDEAGVRVFEGPALFIAGGRSGYLATEAQRQAVFARFPNTRIEVLRGAGHWLQADDPAGFCHLLTEFVEA